MSKYVVAAMSLFGLVLLTGSALAQVDDVAKLKKELDLLTRERDLLKKENELLKKEISQLKAKGEALPASKFLGRWKFVNEKGVVSSYMTITKTGALRDHAPNFPGTWKIVGNEMRLTWKDGFQNILRLGSDGKMTYYGMKKGDTDWQSSPNFILHGQRIP